MISPHPTNTEQTFLSRVMPFRVEQGVLHCGETSIEDVVEQFGTPLYLYDANTIESRLDSLRRTFGPDFTICYSIKANPQQRLLKYFNENDCGLEAASDGEIHQALQAGCPAENLLLAGPGKTPEVLTYAVEQGVGEIHVESLTEAARLNEIAGERGRQVSVALRVNPRAEAQGGAMRMGGTASPFGVDEERLEQTLEALVSLKHLRVAGLHVYCGTQILDSDLLLKQYHKTIDLAEKAAQTLGRPLDTIDFGGGLGVAYFSHETDLDLNAVKAEVGEVVVRAKNNPLLSNARLIIEPGRYLVADAGVYVARVLDVKQSREKTFVVLDGGMHHHLAASGNLGQTIKRNFPLAVLNRMDETPVDAPHPVDIVGPLCTPLDTLGRNVKFPNVEVGDLVGVFRSGAYSRGASPMGFLSHRSPPEVWIEGNEMKLIRRRGTLEDLLHDTCGAGGPPAHPAD